MIKQYKEYLLPLLPLVFPFFLRGESVLYFKSFAHSIGMDKFTILTLLILIVGLFTRSKYKYYKPSSWFFFVPFLIIPAIFFTPSYSSILAEHKVVRIVEVFLPIYTAYVYSNKVNVLDDAYLLRFIKYYVVALFIYMIIAYLWWLFFLQYIYDPTDTLGFSRLKTPLGGSTITGDYLAIAPLMSLVIFKNKSFSFIIALFFLFCIYLSGTRTAMFVSLGIIALFYFKSKHAFRHYFLIITGLIICVFVVVSMGYSIERFTHSETSRTLSQGVFLSSFFSANDIVSLLFGSGLGNYFPYNSWLVLAHSGLYQHVDNTIGNTDLLVDPHSSYIWAIMELGLLGLILFFGKFFLEAKRSFTFLINGGYSTIDKLLAAYVLSISLILFAESVFFNYPLLSLNFWFFIIIFSKRYKYKQL